MILFESEPLRVLLGQISRTATGELDATSSHVKLDIVRSDLAPDAIRKIQRQNIDSTAAMCSALVEKPFASSEEWRQFVRRLNAILTSQLLTDGTPPYRSFAPGSPVSYVAPLHIPAFAELFFTVLAHRDLALRGAMVPQHEAIDLAAFAVWGIDLKGHLYADGCGRTALTLAVFLLLRHDQPLPQIASRDAYYAGCYSSAGVLSWKCWVRYFRSACGVS